MPADLVITLSLSLKNSHMQCVSAFSYTFTDSYTFHDKEEELRS